jgi:hypothetical protein
MEGKKEMFCQTCGHQNEMPPEKPKSRFAAVLTYNSSSEKKSTDHGFRLVFCINCGEERWHHPEWDGTPKHPFVAKCTRKT